MYNHAPKDYKCPICLGVQGVESEDTILKQKDKVYEDNRTTVFINSFFIKGNEGHLIVVPNKHVENLYDLDPEDAHAIIDAAQKMAIVLKNAYKCQGITLRQNNEPAGDQHAFHFHLHIYPRYNGDQFNLNSGNKISTTPKERILYIQKIKEQLK